MKLRIALALLLLSTPAYAIPKADETAKAVNGKFSDDAKKYARIFLNGVWEGLATANFALGSANRPKIFCQPEELALTAEQNANILENFVEKHPEYSRRCLAAGASRCFPLQIVTCNPHQITRAPICKYTTALATC